MNNYDKAFEIPLSNKILVFVITAAVALVCVASVILYCDPDAFGAELKKAQVSEQEQARVNDPLADIRGWVVPRGKDLIDFFKGRRDPFKRLQSQEPQ